MNELEFLQERVKKLEAILYSIAFSDKFIFPKHLQVWDGANISLGATSGTKIGTTTSQKLAFYNTIPIVQPTTAVGSASLAGGGGTNLTDTHTFDGYTLQKVVKALRNLGLLA